MNNVESVFKLHKAKVMKGKGPAADVYQLCEELHHEDGTRTRGEITHFSEHISKELAERICAALNGDVVDRINTKLNPQPGDTLVVHLREGDDIHQISAAVRPLAKVNSCLLIFPGQSIQQLDEDAMRRNGWMRYDGRVRRSMDACEGVPLGLLHKGAYREMIQAQTAQKAALQQIIDMNRQHAEDQYGDAEKAEQWACVKAARAAMTGSMNGGAASDQAFDALLSAANMLNLLGHFDESTCADNEANQAMADMRDAIELAETGRAGS